MRWLGWLGLLLQGAFCIGMSGDREVAGVLRRIQVVGASNGYGLGLCQGFSSNTLGEHRAAGASGEHKMAHA